MVAERAADTQDKPPVFQAVPIADIPADAKPDSAPKRRGRPPRDPNAPPVQRPGRKPRSLENRIGGMLIMVNAPLMAFMPTDALDLNEINALAQALDAQAQASPRFRKYLNAALDATSGGQLITVSAVIVARRLARHEIVLPKAADEQLGMLFGKIDPHAVEEAMNHPEDNPLEVARHGSPEAAKAAHATDA